MQGVVQRVEHVLEQVVGQRARRHDALLRVGDRGGLRRADPDRQVPVAVPLAQQHDAVGWTASPPGLRRHRARARRQPSPRIRRAATRRRAVSRAEVRAPDLTSAACRRTHSAEISRAASLARACASIASAARERRHDLLDQSDLTVGRGPERAQVARLDPVRRELGRGDGDGQGRLVEVAPAARRCLASAGRRSRAGRRRARRVRPPRPARRGSSAGPIRGVRTTRSRGARQPSAARRAGPSRTRLDRARRLEAAVVARRAPRGSPSAARSGRRCTVRM